MGKGNRRGNGSRNPQRNNNRIEKIIEKQQQQRPWRIVSSLDPHNNSSSINITSDDQPPPRYHGYIFMCNGKTKTDCFKYRVFGLPPARMDVLDNIHPQMKLFLFDFDLRLLYGIYVPASKGQMSIEPTAFGGRFSAQVRFQIYKDCLPLPESVFKPIIRDNYQGSKFRQELSEEHVQNLISLFRPVDMSPSRAVISPKRSDEPPGFRVYSGPGASCNQDLAGPHVQEGPPRHSQHIRQIEELLAHVSHASVAKSRDMSCQQYYSSEAHQAYVPSLPEEELYNRYAKVPRDNQARLINRNSIAQSHQNSPPQLSTSGHCRVSTNPLSAAYWIAVANESLQKEMVPPHHHYDTRSASTDMAAPSQTPPIQEREREALKIFQHPQTENNDTSSSSAAAPTSVMVQPYTGDGPMHLPISSSAVPGYWTPVTFQDPNQVYSDHSQWQQLASAGVNTEYAPTSVVQTGTNQYVPSTGATIDYYNYGILSGTNGVLVQQHDSTAYYSGTNAVPAQAYDTSAAAYYPSQAGDLAAYYSGTASVHPQPQQAHDSTAVYYHAINTGIPAQVHEVAAAAYYSVNNTGIRGQTHDPAAYYLPENSYGYSHVPLSSAQAPAYWDPNQVAVTHFPQQIIPPESNITSIGGEHSTGAAPTIVPVDGL